jgi:hypothetical protein
VKSGVLLVDWQLRIEQINTCFVGLLIALREDSFPTRDVLPERSEQRVARVRSGHAATHVDATESTLVVSTKHHKAKVPIESILYQDADQRLSLVREELQFNAHSISDRRACPGDKCVVSLGRHLNYVALT